MNTPEMWQTEELVYTQKRMLYTERINVYFSDREPNQDWGYPAQFHNWWAPTSYKLSREHEEFWLLIANPTENSFRVQVQLDNSLSLMAATLITTALSLILL